jgi:hypothetical protein
MYGSWALEGIVDGVCGTDLEDGADVEIELIKEEGWGY